MEMPAGRIASHKRRIGKYYAERPWVPLLVDSELRSLDGLARERVRYIVVDDDVLGSSDPMEATAGFDLRELYRVDLAGRRAMVFELSRRDPPSVGSGPPPRASANESH
jgi:hypothetical protein